MLTKGLTNDRAANLLEPASLVSVFLDHPPRGFSPCLIGSPDSALAGFSTDFDLTTTLEPPLRQAIDRLPVPQRVRRLWRPRVLLMAGPIGAVTIPFCFFSLGQLVNWLIQVQILLQFVWQCAAVILLRRYRPDVAKPFRMWLYPVPALVSLALWIYVFASAPLGGMIFSAAFLLLAIAAYAIFERRTVGTPSRPATE